MEKHFLSANDFTLDSFRLGKVIWDSGWRPDAIVPIWRGGAPVGVCVHEFLKYKGLSPEHYVLKCGSYAGIDQRGQVVFDHAEELYEQIAKGSKVLFIDDVFDSGRTALDIKETLGGHFSELRFAMVYWKPSRNTTNLVPDFYVRKTEEWIVFPHEIEGLTLDEVGQKSADLRALL